MGYDVFTGRLLGEPLQAMISEELSALLSQWQGTTPTPEEWFTLYRLARRRAEERAKEAG